MTLQKQMVEHVLADQETHAANYLETMQKVAASKAIYKDKPVPYLHIPIVYQLQDVETFKSALAQMTDLVRATIDLYLEKQEIRDCFGFDPRLEALIRVPHHYKATVPMGRFDIFYYGPDDYLFCELNADGASAMNEELELSNILTETAVMEAFKKDHTFKTSELFHSWVAEVDTIYSQYCSAKGLGPFNRADTRVAIVDFVDKSSPIEFEVFLEVFKAEGFQCVIVDPRHINVENGRMVYEGEPIDIVYRRLVTKDMMDRYDEIPGFIAGILADQTCVIGSIKTQVIHTKRFFEVLHTETLRQYLTAEQKAFIDAHVPVTRPLKKDMYFSEYVQNREHYIIKPVDYYASKGVCAGNDYSDADWEALLEAKCLEDFIIQTYCPPAFVENVLYNAEKGLLEPHLFRTITGLFIYNEKYAGIYVRGGKNPIISGLHDGYTLSTVVVL